jgi:hypothetical protein
VDLHDRVLMPSFIKAARSRRARTKTSAPRFSIRLARGRLRRGALRRPRRPPPRQKGPYDIPRQWPRVRCYKYYAHVAPLRGSVALCSIRSRDEATVANVIEKPKDHGRNNCQRFRVIAGLLLEGPIGTIVELMFMLQQNFGNNRNNRPLSAMRQ